MSQADRIYRHLQLAGEDGITPQQALDGIGCFRLAARIAELRASLPTGEVIVNVGYTTPSGKHVARYRLVRREPAQLVLAL